jgi:hypothetical protein
MAVILSDTMSRAVVASSSRPGLIFRPGQAGDWLRKSDTYLKHNCEDAESAPLAPSFGVDYAFRVRGSGHLQVLQYKGSRQSARGVGGFQGWVNDVLGSRIILEGIYRMANVGQGPGLVVGGRSFSHQNAQHVHGFYN